MNMQLHQKKIILKQDKEVKKDQEVPDIVTKEEEVHMSARRAPDPLPEPEREYGDTSVPPHDPSRITPTGVKLERKAWTIFEDVAKERGHTKEAYKYAVHKYLNKESLYRRGAVEFIYVGLDEMKRFGLTRDLGCYKVLLQTFPEGKYVPTNAVQEAFEHYPRQQQCTIDLLEQMEHNGVVPDDEFGIMLKKRFGGRTSAARRYRRMMYWMPKFRNMNPYPIPFELPDDSRELAVMALKRMCGYVDRDYKYTVWETDQCDLDTWEKTFIASAQSPTQQELIQNHPHTEPLYVEGPFPVVLRRKMLYYFLLRAEPNINALMKQKQMEKENLDDENLCNWSNFWEDEEQCMSLRPVLTVHEQEDCTVLGLAITGSGSQESLVSWVRLLERSNPNLANTPVFFKILSPTSDLEVVDDNKTFNKDSV